MPGNWRNASQLAAGIVNFQEFLYCQENSERDTGHIFFEEYAIYLIKLSALNADTNLE